MENNNGPGIENPTNKEQPYNQLWNEFTFQNERINDIDLFRKNLYKANYFVDLTIRNGDEFMSVRVTNLIAANSLLVSERSDTKESIESLRSKMDEILAKNGIIDQEPKPKFTTVPKEDISVQHLNEDQVSKKNESLKALIAEEKENFEQLSKILTEFREQSACYITTEKFHFLLKSSRDKFYNIIDHEMGECMRRISELESKLDTEITIETLIEFFAKCNNLNPHNIVVKVPAESEPEELESYN